MKLFCIRLKYYFTAQGLAQVCKVILATLGILWTLIELSSKFSKTFNENIDNNIYVFLIILSVSVIVGIISTFPKYKIVHKWPASDTQLTIKVGDIFDENTNIAIASSNYFDTQYGIASNISLKSQFINRFYHRNLAHVDELINNSLKEQGIEGIFDTKKPQGKQHKFEIGTIAILPKQDRKAFLIVFNEIEIVNNDKIIKTEPEKINRALYCLWNKYKNYGKKQPLSVPVFGSGLSGTTFSYKLLIQQIVFSYTIYSKNSKISNNLSIIVKEENYSPNLFKELEIFLRSIEI